MTTSAFSEVNSDFLGPVSRYLSLVVSNIYWLFPLFSVICPHLFNQKVFM